MCAPQVSFVAADSLTSSSSAAATPYALILQLSCMVMLAATMVFAALHGS